MEASKCALSMMKPVLCVGCTVIDFVTINKTFPEEDSDRRCTKGFWQRGGNASNVCTVLRLLGTQVSFFGMLSRAAAFRVLLDDMQKRHIDYSDCPMTDNDPPFSTVILAQDTGSRTIVHCNSNFPTVTAQDFKQLDLSRFGWVHFEARNVQETMKMIRTVLDYNSGREEKLIISLDFESMYSVHLELCDMCDYVVLSKALAIERGWLTPEQACRGLDDDLQLRRALQLHRPAIVCPWGSEGAGCLDTECNYKQLPAYKPKTVVDTLGAGDCFMAAFINATYVRQRLLHDAVDMGNQVASHKITKFGYDHIAALNLNRGTSTGDDDGSAGAYEDDNYENPSEDKDLCLKYLSREIKPRSSRKSHRKHAEVQKAVLAEEMNDEVAPMEAEDATAADRSKQSSTNQNDINSNSIKFSVR